MTNQYLIYQSSQKAATKRITTIVLGVVLAAVLAFVATKTTSDTTLLACLSFAIVLFGAALVLTLRKKREFEIFELNDGTAFIKSHDGVSFEGKLHETKLQRVRLPNGTMKIFLRNGVHAVEIASSLNQKVREKAAAEVESILKGS